MKKKKTQHVAKKSVSKGLAIVCLLLNIFILPGLGSLIGGRTKAGVWQLVLVLAGVPLSLVLIGFPMILIAWIWSIVTGVQIIQEAR